METTIKLSENAADLKRIIQLRYEILRAPWQQRIESATDELDVTSINAYIENADGEVIACARLQINENQIGQVRYMAVANSQQEKGLGKNLLLFLENKARKLGLKSISLQARENAYGFYEKLGYHEVEKSFLLWGKIQHYLMEKNL